MKTAIITIGCSGSGKTTWACEHARKMKRETGETWMIIERDGVRKGIKHKSSNDVNFWSEWNWKLEGQVTNTVDGMLSVAFAANMNIIVSDTNLNPHFRSLLIQKLMDNGYTVEQKHFNMQYKQLIERDNKRADSVGQQVIAKQYFQYMEQFADSMGYKKLDNTPWEACVLFDVDGTLAHMNGARGPFEWEKVGLDTVDAPMRQLARMYKNAGFRVIIMSGRDAVCRSQTVEWLNKHEIPFEDIFMRAENDMRSDFEVKNEIIQREINGKYRVEAWFDDRPQIVRLGNILGAKIFAVGNQHEEF